MSEWSGHEGLKDLSLQKKQINCRFTSGLKKTLKPKLKIRCKKISQIKMNSLGVAPNTIPLFEKIGRHHAVVSYVVVSCGGGFLAT
jgi:hypothetical protein